MQKSSFSTKPPLPVTSVPTPTSIPSGATTSPSVSPTPSETPPPAGDKPYGDYWRQVYQQYSWYDSFPIQTDLYYVYFDVQAKSFIADIYPKSASSQSTDAQVTSAKQAIQTKLVSLGVNLDQFPIEWNVTVQ